VLATNLSYNMALKELIVHHAELKAAGGSYIATAIQKQRIKTVTTLDMSYVPADPSRVSCARSHFTAVLRGLVLLCVLFVCFCVVSQLERHR